MSQCFLLLFFFNILYNNVELSPFPSPQIMWLILTLGNDSVSDPTVFNSVTFHCTLHRPFQLGPISEQSTCIPYLNHHKRQKTEIRLQIQKKRTLQAIITLPQLSTSQHCFENYQRSFKNASESITSYCFAVQGRCVLIKIFK